MTTERLHSETARANAAERQVADVMSHFKDVHGQKVKLERELMRVREELGLYKVQLDVAQKGRRIFL
jgi:predicted  nucleic acid-binding Zn-ribbon protein